MSLLKWKELEKKRKAEQIMKEKDEQIREYKFKKAASADFYKTTFEPITEKIEEQTKGLEEKLDIFPEPMLRANAPPMIEQEGQPQIEARPPLQANLDVNIDKNVLKEYGIKPLSEVANDEAHTWPNTRKNVSNKMRALSKQISRLGYDDPGIRTLIHRRETFRIYSSRLKDMHDNKGMFGQGIHSPYKMGKDGQYGKLSIDVTQLVDKHRLTAKEGETILLDEKVDHILLDEKVDHDFIDLITKRIATKRKYSNLSQDVFKRLTDLSDLSPNKRSKKFNGILKGGCIPTFYNSPDDLLDFLELIIGSINAGNDNAGLKNKGMSIIDELLKLGSISGDVHEELYRKYFI